MISRGVPLPFLSGLWESSQFYGGIWVNLHLVAGVRKRMLENIVFACLYFRMIYRDFWVWFDARFQRLLPFWALRIAFRGCTHWPYLRGKINWNGVAGFEHLLVAEGRFLLKMLGAPYLPEKSKWGSSSSSFPGCPRFPMIPHGSSWFPQRQAVLGVVESCCVPLIARRQIVSRFGCLARSAPAPT